MATTTRSVSSVATASGSPSARRGRREAALVGGSLVAAAIAHGASMLAPAAATAAAADPALARLLLGMAFVKLAFVAAMAGLAAWRFRHPLADGTALGYLACVWAATAATVLIWQSAWLGFASVLFHGAGFAFMVLGLRDDRVLPAALRARERG